MKSENWVMLLMLLIISFSARSQDREVDTVKVIMLVCDTSQDSGSKLNALGIVFWDHGYSIREKHHGSELYNGGSCWNCPDFWKHVKYLDYKKRILKNSWVVWQSQPVQ